MGTVHRAIQHHSIKMPFAFDSITAPLLGDERPPPCAVSGRMRRRGPRSLAAMEKRASARMPPGDASGPPLAQSPANTLINVLPQQITVLVVNAQSINSEVKLARLTHLLQTHLPTLVAVSETWLDASTVYLAIPGYELVARRDRPGYIPRPEGSIS